jgi:cell division protein FtsZ
MDMNILNDMDMMDDNNNSQFLAFDSPLNQSSFIKVVGVGGGGNNAVNHMFRKGITGVDFIVCNTDMKALNGSPVPNKLPLGHSGMGAGNDPAKARRAAESKEQEIKELFEHNTKMVFITAGMGGGTGTGAAPVIARIAKEVRVQDDDMDEDGRILVVAVVTTPFQFEGRLRLRQALEGVEELRKHVDSILVINNEKLRGYGNLVITDAFAMANDVLLTAVKGIAEIITLNAFVNIDFRDVNTVMENSGTALMGIGEGEGENRALQAVEQAATSVLLDDNDIAGAKNVLLYFSYGPDNKATMDEMGAITDYLGQKTGAETNVIWGTGEDESLGDRVKITLIATGFEQKERPEGMIIQLPEPEPAQTPKVVPPTPAGEPHIVQRPEVHTRPGDERWDVADRVVKEPAAEPARPAVETKPAPTPHVIPLYEEEERKSASSAPQRPADDGMRIVQKEQGGVDAERPGVSTERTTRRPVDEKAEQAQPTAESLMMETMSRAERIKMMHDLLRNHADGAAKVEAMNPMELTGEQLFQAAHSSESAVKNPGVTADGKIKPNSYLYTSVD